LLAFIFGFAGGCILIARLLKCYLQDQDYFKAKDRECTMLFGKYEEKGFDDKFSIDQAASSHRNRIRDSNDKMFDDDFESKRPQGASPFEEAKIESKSDLELPKAHHSQSNKYEQHVDEEK
jgi:hypothetical protein